MEQIRLSRAASLRSLIFGDEARKWTAEELVVVACRFIAESKFVLLLAFSMLYALQMARVAEDASACRREVLDIGSCDGAPLRRCDAYALCRAHRAADTLLGLRLNDDSLDLKLLIGILMVTVVNLLCVLYCVRSSDNAKLMRSADIALCFEINRNLSKWPVQLVRWATLIGFTAAVTIGLVVAYFDGELFVLLVNSEVLYAATFLISITNLHAPAWSLASSAISFEVFQRRLDACKPFTLGDLLYSAPSLLEYKLTEVAVAEELEEMRDETKALMRGGAPSASPHPHPANLRS